MSARYQREKRGKVCMAKADWYADPTGRHEHRYWDGSAWTLHVANAGVQGTDELDADLPSPDSSVSSGTHEKSSVRKVRDGLPVGQGGRPSLVGSLTRWALEHTASVVVGLVAVTILIGAVGGSGALVLWLLVVYWVGGFAYTSYYAAKHNIVPGYEWLLVLFFAWWLVLLYYKLQVGSTGRCVNCRGRVREDARVCPHCQLHPRAMVEADRETPPSTRSPSNVEAGRDLQRRFAEIDALHEAGAISEEEYQRTRQRLLEEL